MQIAELLTELKLPIMQLDIDMRRHRKRVFDVTGAKYLLMF